jgi:hypothetical protein
MSGALLEMNGRTIGASSEINHPAAETQPIGASPLPVNKGPAFDTEQLHGDALSDHHHEGHHLDDVHALAGDE